MANCCECDCSRCGSSEPSQIVHDQCKADFSNSPACDLKRCKSYELRGGVYYMTCDCIKKNGLQDDCRRTCCHGSCECQESPEPTCCPSKYAKRLMFMPMGIQKKEK